MQITVRPRQVEPKAVLRWLVQAADLVGRGFHVWVGMMLLFCLMTYGTLRSSYLSQIIAMTAYFVGVGVAALVDDSTHPPFTAIARNAWKNLPSALMMALIIVSIGTGLNILFGSLGGHGIQLKQLWDPSKPALPLTADFLLSMRRLFGYSLGSFWLSLMVMVAPFVASFFQYHLMCILGLGWWQAYLIGDGGGDMNWRPIFFMFLVLIITPIMLLLIMPVLAPVFYCFASAFTYVAFRDIYLGITENRKIVAADAPVIAAQAAG